MLRWPARLLIVVLQSSPVVLTLVISAAVAHASLPVLLRRGDRCGHRGAWSDEWQPMPVRRSPKPCIRFGQRGAGRLRPTTELYGRAVSRSATQIVSFLINAAKGTPIASFIGAPELLSALTDITSFASGRASTYSLLLVFYIAVVIVVVWLCGKLQTLARTPSGDGGMSRISPDFLPQLLAGMVVNFEIAAIALLVGLAVGGLLTWAKLVGGVVRSDRR